MPDLCRATGRRKSTLSVLLLICVFRSITFGQNADSSGTARPVLASTDFYLVGLAVSAEPASQTVPKNTASAILTHLDLPPGVDSTEMLAGVNPNYRVRAELVGPSLAGALTIESAIGGQLAIPALARAGDHLLQNLRVVDISLPGGPAVAEVRPDACRISVLDQLLVSEVQVHELTYDEMVRSGISIDPDSYSYYAFTLALGTTSDGQTITIPVALPRPGVDSPPLVGTPKAPIGQNAPLPDVLPVLLKPKTGEGSQLPEFEQGQIRIPGLIVFPGRIGLLHQFFEAIVIVTNGAPEGTPLVVRSLRATVRLPQAPNPTNNPLRVAELQVGGQVEELEIHGLGPDRTYGTGDDSVTFRPGESGQASFLLEGLKEGLHNVTFRLEGTLDGLPVGPVDLEGDVSGAVLVRDGRFAVTFTHPSVVRAGQEYELGITLFNSGTRDLLGAYAELNPGSIVGADLVSDPLEPTATRAFPTSMSPGESGTVVWKLRARVTGAVTASYAQAEAADEVGLDLVTGVGDRNVPLSPDSLILPDPVRYLPGDVVEASRNLLGQAWSIATAPSGTLPAGVVPVSKRTVLDRAVELAVAGLRVRFGESVHVSLVTLLCDWLGELQDVPDEGFADTLGATPSGYAWFDSLGAQLAGTLASGTSVDTLHEEAAKGEMARSRFLSAFVTQPEGAPIAGARLIAPDGQAVGLAGPQDRFGAVARGALLQLDAGQARSRGSFLLVSEPDPGRWLLEIQAWRPGTVDVSLLLPTDDDSYRLLTFSDVQVIAGLYRIQFDPYFSSTAVVEQCAFGACTPSGRSASVEYLDEAPPSVTGVVQLSPTILDSGDRYGRVVAVLFSKPAAAERSENAANYRIGDGRLVGSNPSQIVGQAIGVTEARLNLGGRFAFLALSSPIGPFISRTLTISGVTDVRGIALSPAALDLPIETTVSPGGLPPGGYLTGRVLDANGEAAVKAPVTLSVRPCAAGSLPLLLSTVFADPAGKYVFDYVVNGDCSPVFVSAVNPVAGASKQLSTPVSYHGQHLVIDLVFLARGAVAGTVTLDGSPVAGAYVQVVPESDPAGGKLVRADSTGHYLAADIPVGRVSVLAVGADSQAAATGFAAGWIAGPDGIAQVDVALQSLSGSIEGKVQEANGQAVANMLVVAKARLPGITDPVIVEYAYTATDGTFGLERLPLGSVTLVATEYVTGLEVSQQVQLTSQTPLVSGIVLSLPGFGSITGRVTDQSGRFLAGVEVSCGSSVIDSDGWGYYTVPIIPAGTRTVRATNPQTGLSGSRTVTVVAGQTTTGADIVIKAAATLRGTISIVQSAGGTAVPVVGAIVSHDGRHAVTTNSQGLYSLTDIEPGRQYIVRFVHPGGRLAVNQKITLSPGETMTRDVTFHPAGIGGKIYQPDGQTGAAARVSLYVPLPILTPGDFYGLLDASKPITTLSGGDGSYLITGVLPADFRITAYNDFFPTAVTRSGRLLADAQVTCNLVLVDSLGGTVNGRVFQPDGLTPAGAGVTVSLGGGWLADAQVVTDSNGEYRFPEVFASGSYDLTARDPKTDDSNRVRISVETNKDVLADIRLLGRGQLQVSVIDASGNPVESGAVDLAGLDFPNWTGRIELEAGTGGYAVFQDLPEGPYAVTASSGGLSGRVAAVVPTNGGGTVTVSLQPAGTVSGVRRRLRSGRSRPGSSRSWGERRADHEPVCLPRPGCRIHDSYGSIPSPAQSGRTVRSRVLACSPGVGFFAPRSRRACGRYSPR